MEMDFDDLLTDFDWEGMDILNNRNPTLLNNPPAFAPQQPSVQDLVGNVATPNQAQNTEPSSFDFSKETTSSSMGNLSQLVADNLSARDQLPQLSPKSFGPLLDETLSASCYVPPLEGMIQEGAGSSSVQSEGEWTAMDYYNHYSHLLDNNEAMMPNMGQQNEHNHSNNQMLMPHNLANQNFNGMDNQQPSSYPCIAQQNPVKEGGVGNKNTNGHFMTDQTTPFSALNNHAINPCNAWNSPGEKTQGNGYNPLRDIAGFQQPSSTFNDPTTLNSGFAVSSELNSAFLGFQGSGANELSFSQMLNMDAPQIETLFRNESAALVQPQQVPPLSNPMNSITPTVADNGLPMSPPPLGAQPLVPTQNMLNQNDISMVTPNGGPYATLQQNPSQNPTSERREPPRRGRPRKQFEPGLVTAPVRRRKKVSYAKEKAGKTPASQAKNAAAPRGRKIPAPLYDVAYEDIGLPRDPLVRAKKLAEAQKAAALAATAAPMSAELAATETPISVELAATAAPISAELAATAPPVSVAATVAAPASVELAATAAAPASVELAATVAAPTSVELAATAAPNSAELATTM